MVLNTNKQGVLGKTELFPVDDSVGMIGGNDIGRKQSEVTSERKEKGTKMTALTRLQHYARKTHNHCLVRMTPSEMLMLRVLSHKSNDSNTVPST